MDIRETELHPWGWREEGETLVHEDLGKFPAKFIVCECCRGTGRVVNPSIDGNGLSQEDFDEDPDFRENYFSGSYDINCPHCKGVRVVLYPATPEGEEAYLESQKSQYSHYAEMAAERAMGC